MKKREFLGGALVGGAVAVSGAAQAQVAARGPGLLTITGAIKKTNRGAIDPQLDLLMVHHSLRFEKALEMDAASLAGLPAVTIRPTLEYDAKRHTLSGPLLSTVVEAAGVSPNARVALALRAVDGYNVTLSLADAQAYRMMVAVNMDGKALALGGLGPQWAVYEADSLEAFKSKPLKERFALCPWSLYHIEVKSL